MAKCLYSGDKPLGIVQSNADDISYGGGLSVKDKIDGMIQCGTIPHGTTRTGDQGLITVVFDQEFAKTPKVVCTPIHATSPGMYVRACCICSVSTTGFSFSETAVGYDGSTGRWQFYDGTMTTDGIHWIATDNY